MLERWDIVPDVFYLDFNPSIFQPKACIDHFEFTKFSNFLIYGYRLTISDLELSSVNDFANQKSLILVLKSFLQDTFGLDWQESKHYIRLIIK
jgi:hypothetical protein